MSFFDEIVDYSAEKNELRSKLEEIEKLVNPIVKRISAIEEKEKEQEQKYEKILTHIKTIENQFNNATAATALPNLEIVFEKTLKEIHVYEGSNLVDGFRVNGNKWEQSDDIKRTLLSSREQHAYYGKMLNFLYSGFDQILQ